MIDPSKLPKHIDAAPDIGNTRAAEVGTIARQLAALYKIMGIWWCDSCETFHSVGGDNGWQQKALANPDDPASPVYYPPTI